MLVNVLLDSLGHQLEAAHTEVVESSLFFDEHPGEVVDRFVGLARQANIRLDIIW